MSRKSVLTVATFVIVMVACSVDRAFAQFGQPMPRPAPRKKVDPVLERQTQAILNAARDGNWALVKQMLRTNPELATAKTSSSLHGKAKKNGVSLLHMAAADGNNKIATLLLSKDADINAEDNGGWTPIFHAASAGQAGMVKYLIGRGANIDDRRKTPLILVAVQSYDSKTIRVLKHAGATAGSPVLDAIIYKDAETLRKLLAEDPSRTQQSVPYLQSQPLQWAVLVGDEEIVRILLDYDAKIQPPTGMPVPFCLAIQTGNVEVARLLFPKDFSRIAPTYVIRLAVEGGNAKMVEFLIEKGLNFRETKIHGYSLMFHCGSAEVAALLIENGLKVDEQTKNGRTPLHAATQRGNKELVLFLIDRGAKTKFPAGTNTPLHIAANAGNLEIVKILLAKNADINAIDKKKTTPLFSALHGRKNKVVEFLIKKGADIKAVDSEGRTPLYLAAGMDDPGIVRTLIEMGADVNAYCNIKLRMGQSYRCCYPIEKAVMSGNIEIMEILIKSGADLKKSNPLLAALDNQQSEIAMLLIKKYPDAVHASGGSGNIYEQASVKAPDIFILLVEHAPNVNEADARGLTPLHFAARTGNNKAIEILIKRGADVNARSNEQSGGGVMRWNPAFSLPIELAADRKHNETVKLLVKNGADLSIGATLHIYIKARNREMCAYLLEHGANSNALDSMGERPLHVAIALRDHEMVKTLLDKGADINAPDNHGKPPVFSAMQHRDHVLFELLVKQGADLTIIDKKGYTLLHLAAAASQERIVQILIEQGADVNAKTKHGESVLVHALHQDCKMKIARYLIEHGANVNAADMYGDALIFVAIRDNDQEVLELLLDNDANLKLLDRNGNPPIYAALAYKHEQFIRMLVEKGADINAKNKNGEPALILAIRNRSKVSTVKYLLDKGADINITDAQGRTLLYAAVERGEMLLIEMLLAKGADTNAQTKFGDAPIFGAIRRKDQKLLELLIEKGARVKIADGEGCTPLHRAAVKNQKKIVEIIVEQGADLNAKTQHGEPVLIMALRCNCKSSIAIYLVKKGADLSLTNTNGKTALHWAAETANTEVVKFLLEHGVAPCVRDQDGKTPRDYVDEKIKKLANASRSSQKRLKQQYEKLAEILENAEKTQQAQKDTAPDDKPNDGQDMPSPE